MVWDFDWQQFLGAFFVLFAIIDILGSIPIILNLRKRGKIIKPAKTAFLSWIMFIIFYFVGEAFLHLFGVDIPSFAVAGSIVIFMMACEMILDISIFKETNDASKDASFFPVVFPLVAGAGALTTMLAIRSQYSPVNLIAAITANTLFVYVILVLAKKIEKFLGAGMMYMVKKFCGIILLAISVKLFASNVTLLIENFLNS